MYINYSHGHMLMNSTQHKVYNMWCTHMQQMHISAYKIQTVTINVNSNSDSLLSVSFMSWIKLHDAIN